MPSLPQLQALISNGTSLNCRLTLGSEVHAQTPSSTDTHPSTWQLHVPSRSSHRRAVTATSPPARRGKATGAGEESPDLRGGGAWSRLASLPQETSTSGHIHRDTPTAYPTTEKGVASTQAFLLAAHRWDTAVGFQRVGMSGPLPQKAALNVIQGSSVRAQIH